MRTRVQIRALMATIAVTLAFATAAQSNPPVQLGFTDGGLLIIHLSLGQGSNQGSAHVDGMGGDSVTDIAIVNDVSNVFSLACGGTAHECMHAFPVPAAFQVTCTTATPGMYFATIQATGTGGGSDTATETLECDVDGPVGPVAIMNKPLMGLGGSAGSTPNDLAEIVSSAGSDMLASARIVDDGTHTGGVFSIVDGGCLGGSPTTDCQYGSPQSLPRSVEVQCTVPSDGGLPHTATLVVTGAGGGSGDTDSAALSCQETVTAGPPILSVGSGSGFLTNVGVPATGGVPVSNTAAMASGSNLTVTASITSGSDFTASSCTGGCTLAPGSGADVEVTFAPTHWGSSTGVLELDAPGAEGSPAMVALSGQASGAEITVSPMALDLGTLPLGTTGSATFTVHADGNIAVQTTVTGATAPFAVTPGSATEAAGSDSTFTVTCGSDTPTTDGNGAPAPFTETLAVATPGAYVGSSFHLDVTCEIANTHVQVSPASFDFGESRVGDSIPPMTLTITNPTAAPVSVDSIALLRGDDGLTLAAPTDATTLAPGGTLVATLTLSSAQATNLDAPREAVEIAVTDAGQQSHLELLVTGEVGTPASAISPPALDLGTACIGESVGGSIVLSNVGTATLAVQAPAIGSAFAIAFTDPAGYPAALAPGSAATIGVSSADTTTLGTRADTVTWADDGPGSGYAVPVTVTYIAQGAAVSPYTLTFGTIGVGYVSQPALITLQNCDATPRTVDIADVAAVSGTADAWAVRPHGSQTLAPHAQLLVAVTFTPHYADPYDASVQVTIDGQATSVQLLGQGSGDPKDRTFYGCGCEGGGGGGAGLVGGCMPFAVLLTLSRRRRRGSS